LARAAQENVQLTQSGAIMGTPAYMAPEQARAKPVDHRADLFSLGIILYEITTGRRPFTGSDTMSILSSLALDHPAAPHELNPEVPQELSKLITQLLAKEPEKRVQTAAEVVTALVALEPHCCPAEPVKNRPPSRNRLVGIVAMSLLLIGAVAFGTYQLIFKTESGTLIVHVEGDADIRFKNGKLQIYDESGKLKYELEPAERNKRLPAGKYTVKVTGVDGLKLDTDKFEMTRSGSNVTVSMEQQSVAKNPDAKDADRRAALWALNSGARSVLIVAGGQEKRITRLAEIPSTPFELVELDFYEVRQIDNSGFAQVAALQNLRILGLAKSGISDVGLEHLCRCKSIERLDLWATGVTDAGMYHVRKLSQLTDLVVMYTKITDVGLAQVKECAQLRCLYADHIPLSVEGLRSIGLMKKLTWLSLRGNPAVSDGLPHLQSLPALGYLDIRNTGVRNDGIAGFKKTRLTVLDLGESHITDACVPDLCGLDQLRELNLENTALSRNAVVSVAAALLNCRVNSKFGTFGPGSNSDRRAAEWALAAGGKIRINDQAIEVPNENSLPSEPFRLTWVNLHANTKVTDRDLALLSDCTHIERLYLGATPITNAGLVHHRLGKLTTAPRATPITNAGLVHLSRLTRLRSLHLGHTRVGDTGMKFFRAFKNIEKLYLGATGVSIAGLTNFKDCSNLDMIDLFSATIDDQSLQQFSYWPKLTSVALTKTNVTPAGVRSLRKLMPNCRIESDFGTFGPGSDSDRDVARWVLEKAGVMWAWFGNNAQPSEIKGELPTTGSFQIDRIDMPERAAVVDADIERLAGLTKLRTLVLSSSKVSDAGMAHLGKIGTITDLQLFDTRVGDTGLERIKPLNDLRLLNLARTRVTSDGMVHLSGFTNLENLNLRDTAIADGGLPHLASCKNLRLLHLNKTHVTAAGVKKLSMALPKCTIESDFGTFGPK
jgi:Leucine-rich repeat (LRR) protein